MIVSAPVSIKNVVLTRSPKHHSHSRFQSERVAVPSLLPLQLTGSFVRLRLPADRKSAWQTMEHAALGPSRAAVLAAVLTGFKVLLLPGSKYVLRFGWHNPTQKPNPVEW